MTLTEIFGETRKAGNPVHVSSIKGNIGHCEAASGAAGLAKLLLMFQKEVMPMQAGLTHLNPRLHGFKDGGLVVPRENIPWKKRNGVPRRALLNNFGAAGSNAMLVLEEPPTLTDSRHPDMLRSAYLFNLSARSPEALERSISIHQRFLDKHGPALRLDDICYTATARREVYSHRISLSCSSVQDLSDHLLKVRVPRSSSQTQDRRLVFVFSGQGASYPGMGQELLRTSPLFRNIVQQCDAILIRLGVPSVISFLNGNDSYGRLISKKEEVVITQCACVLLEYALARLVMSWGIMPQHLVGHRYASFHESTRNFYRLS